MNVEILSEGLEENEAFEIEKNIIRLAGKAIDGNGTLFSLADGGKSIGNNYFDSIGDIKSYGVNDRLSKQDKASREFLHHYAAGIQ